MDEDAKKQIDNIAQIIEVYQEVKAKDNKEKAYIRTFVIAIVLSYLSWLTYTTLETSKGVGLLQNDIKYIKENVNKNRSDIAKLTKRITSIEIHGKVQ